MPRIHGTSNGVLRFTSKGLLGSPSSLKIVHVMLCVVTMLRTRKEGKIDEP